MLKSRIKQLLIQKKLPFIGEFKETFAQVLFWVSILNGMMVAGTFYYTTLRHIVTWLNLGLFITIIAVFVLIAFIIEYKYIVPSIWAFRGNQLGMNNQTKFTKDREIVVAVTGGFDPLHSGHIDHFEEALKLGSSLIVILKRDEQLVGKKHKLPMPYESRKKVIEWGLKGRGLVVENIDKDQTSVESLKKYEPDIFAKGDSSWNDDNLPEKEVCIENGIKIIYGVGGLEKQYSSSDFYKEIKK